MSWCYRQIATGLVAVCEVALQSRPLFGRNSQKGQRPPENRHTSAMLTGRSPEAVSHRLLPNFPLATI